MPLTRSLANRLANIYPSDSIYTQTSDCWVYGYDNSRLHTCPDAVVFPVDHDQVVKTVALCNEQRIALTTRGRGTNTTGASVPVNAGIVLSMERMDRFLELNAKDRTATVEPGITNLQLQQTLQDKGFFWGPDPSSAAYCTIGGNIACNAAGPRAVKYGATRENVYSLIAVTGNGETIKTGARTTKSAVGYDLTRLLIGSEGTLAIVTQATLKLTPLPPQKTTIQALYTSNEGACRAVSAVMSKTPVPCALEFMDSSAVALLKKHGDLALDSDAEAILMVEVDGEEYSIDRDTQRIVDNLKNLQCLSAKVANSPEEIAALWSARKALSPILRSLAPNKINEDVAVPVSRLTDLITTIEHLSRRFDLLIVNFGHAGNGNVHVNIMYDAGNTRENDNALSCLDEIFSTVIQLGGTLSGEHGTGLVKRDYVTRELDSGSIRLMTAIKRQFDPNNILNPGKSPYH